MSGTDAAATLSLKIDTHGAKADLEALKNEYTSLHAAMREGLPKLGGTDVPVQQAKASLGAYVNEFKAAGQQISSMKFTFPALTAGNGDVLAGYRGKIKQEFEIVRAELASQVKELGADLALANAQITSLVAAGTGQATKTLGVRLGAGAGSVGATVGLDSNQIKTLNEKLKAVGLEAAKALDSGFTTSNFSKTNQVVAAFAKNTEASLQSVIRMAQDAKRLADTVGPKTADITYGPLVTGGEAEAEATRRLDALRSASIAASVKAKLEARNKALVSAVDKSTSDLVLEMRRANAARQKAESEALANQWIAENKDALQASSIAASVKAKLEARNKALVSAVDKSTSDLVLEMRRANAARQKAESGAINARDERSLSYISGTPVQQASQTLRASIAQTNGYDLTKHAPEALNAAQRLGSVDASAAALAAAKATAELERANKTLTPAIKQSTDHQINWNKVANEGHAAVRGLAGSLGTLWITYGQLAPLLAGAALGSAFVNTAKAGSEFAYQLTFVKALGNESAEAVERLSSAATMLGQNSLQGPVELASGFRILAQAGLSGANSILAMSSVLDLAVVGEMDMAQAGTTLVGVMNAFGLSVTSASHVGDVFAKAAALSQTSVQGMTEAMKTASVVGEQYGATLEDTATAITLLAKVNITGTSAGTAFRNMLKELYAPTAGAAGVIKQLGLETSDAQGKLKSFPDIVYSLRTILEEFNKTSQVNILQKMFGERGAKEAIAMLALTRDEWDKLNGSISNSSGFMREVASELESTTKGVFTQALNTLKTGFVDVFNKTEGPMKDMAIRLKSLFSSSEFTSGLSATVSFMAKLASVSLTAASALSTLFAAIPTGTGTLVSAAAAAAAVTLSLSYLTTKLALVATGMSSLSIATLAALSPMAPLYIAVGTLTAAYVLFNSKTPDSINSINALNSALDTQISRLQLVNAELVRKIGLESGSASNDTAAVRKEISAGKAQLAEYDRLLASDLESKRSGKTTVIGDMARNLFTTDEKEREDFSKTREARVRRPELASKLAEAEQKLRIAEGYEDQIRINSSKAQVQEALRQQDLESRMKTGTKVFVAEGKDKGAKTGSGSGSNRGELKDARSILSENLSSALKQEQIQLGREVIGIETQLAAQTISATVAQENKNAATLTSLENEKKLIEQYLQQARAMKDKVETTKFENDLSENALKIEKQRQQANLDSVKARTADSNSINDSILSSQRYAEGLQFEAALLGTTALETAHLRAEREALLALENLSVRESRKQVTPDVADQERAAINANRDALKADAEFKESWLGGWSEAFDAHNKRATSAAQSAKDSFAAMASAMEDALGTFVTTGKLNFASFAKSLIADIAKIEARALMSKLLSSGGGSSSFIKGAIGLVAGMFGGGGSVASTAVSTVPGFSAGTLGNGITLRSANGNVFSGSPSLHAYANTVQTSPKTFAYQNLHGFAKGGVFAEAGPEAVMPLTRDSRGRLGVRSQGGGDGRITIINQTTGRIDRVSEKTLSSGERALIIEEAVATTAAQFADPNSKTSRSMHRTFNLQRNR
jgi:TP901 family phage tail tape measure protein/lambda family phage tail tape measure protein